MSATLTLDLFRPSILDPAEAGEQLRAALPAMRQRSARGDQPHPAAPVRERVTAPDPSGDQLRLQDLRPAPGGGGPTLDDLLVGVWEDLTAHRTVACPACGEAMAPRYSAGHAPVGGRCRGCGTTIE